MEPMQSQPENPVRTAVLLAGHNNKKALIKLYGETLLQIVFHKLRPIFDKIFIIADSYESKLKYEKLLAEDILVDFEKDKWPMSSILTGLKTCSDEYIFAASCDMPFLNKDVIKHICSKMPENPDQAYDALLPRFVNGKIEPLHAVYRTKPCVKVIKDAFNDELFKPEEIFAGMTNVQYIPVGELTEFDPKLDSFFHIRSEIDLQTVKQRMQKKVYKNRLKKAQYLKPEILKDLETGNATYYRVPGSIAEHEVRFDKRKNKWSCDCKYFTLKASYCSHILAVQSGSKGI